MPGDDDFHDDVDDTSEFGTNAYMPHQFQFPTQDTFNGVSKPQTYSNKKKTPSKQTNSKHEHTEYSINAPQSYLIGAAISPAIIPLAYYPVQPANVGTLPTTTNGNSKKSSSSNRPKPLKKPSTNESQRNVPYNAVPLIWYPSANYHVYSSNVQRDLNPGHSTHYLTTKSPVIRQPSKQTNQIQTMSLAAYYGYLNNLNSKQKHPN